MGEDVRVEALARKGQKMRAVGQPDKPTEWWSSFAAIFVALLVLLLLFFLTAIPLYGL